MKWTEEKIEYLKDNLNNKSYLEISGILGTTHKAVIIKAHRLKLKKRRDGKFNSNWGCGKTKKMGYIWLSCKKECPYSYKDGRVAEHYYVWWKEYGMKKPILRGEILHHKNENKTDNRVENLEKLKLSEHMRLHRKLNPFERGLDGKFIKRKDG